MYHEQDDVLFARTRKETHAHQWPLLQIEAVVRLLDKAAVKFRLAPRRGVNLLKTDFHVVKDVLPRLIPIHAEGGSQAGMSIQQRLKRAPQGRGVQVREDADDRRYVIGRT